CRRLDFPRGFNHGSGWFQSSHASLSPTLSLFVKFKVDSDDCKSPLQSIAKTSR
ncbi:hypothetical protein GIB67_025272, partial [Kingdonia uniflora]